MEKKKVFVPVSVEDGLPSIKNIKTIACNKSVNQLSIFYTSAIIDQPSQFNYWMKEQEMYCFTADELKSLIFDAYATGVLSAQSGETKYFLSPYEYIISLKIK